MRGPEYLDSRRKRIVDKSAAATVLAITLPLYGWMYLENKKQRQPLFFKQPRVGKNGELFDMWKFETLYQGAENEEEHSKQLHRSPEEKTTDSRVKNRRMRFARRNGINELPQVVNVFKGKMSIVGPRPQSQDYLKASEKLFPDLMIEWKKTALSVTPGLLGTSPLRTRGLAVEDFEKTVRADIEYFHNATLLRDFKIIAQAILGIFR